MNIQKRIIPVIESLIDDVAFIGDESVRRIRQRVADAPIERALATLSAEIVVALTALDDVAYRALKQTINSALKQAFDSYAVAFERPDARVERERPLFFPLLGTFMARNIDVRAFDARIKASRSGEDVADAIRSAFDRMIYRPLLAVDIQKVEGKASVDGVIDAFAACAQEYVVLRASGDNVSLTQRIPHRIPIVALPTVAGTAVVRGILTLVGVNAQTAEAPPKAERRLMNASLRYALTEYRDARPDLFPAAHQRKIEYVLGSPRVIELPHGTLYMRGKEALLRTPGNDVFYDVS